nr:unnamed protein product [Callosobruchus analis]
MYTIVSIIDIIFNKNAIFHQLKVYIRHKFPGKGRGVIAAKKFQRGDFVVEYKGDLIDMTEAKIREENMPKITMLVAICIILGTIINSIAESGKLGRLVNHSRNGNLSTRTILIDNKPRLVLIAKDSIEEGEELLYDYGDRSKESLKHHPWLAY